MAKLLKQIGKSFKKSNSDQHNHNDHGNNNSNHENKFNTMMSNKTKTCGWSAILDLPFRFDSRRPSEPAKRLASHYVKCSDHGCNHKKSIKDGCRSFHSCHQKVNKIHSLNSSSFDSNLPQMLDYYSDPFDMKKEMSESSNNMSNEEVSGCHDDLSSDEEYSVPYVDSNKIIKKGLYERPWDLRATHEEFINNMSSSLIQNPPSQSSIHPQPPPHQFLSQNNIPLSSSDLILKNELLNNNYQQKQNEKQKICKNSQINSTSGYFSPSLKQNIINKNINIDFNQNQQHFSNLNGKEKEEEDEEEEEEDDILYVDPPSPPLPSKTLASHVVPLEFYSWFLGDMSRLEAEEVLGKENLEGTYLVRKCESSKNDFSLSLKSGEGFLHMKIVKQLSNQSKTFQNHDSSPSDLNLTNQKSNNSNDYIYILGEFSQPFPSIPSIIEFFTNNKLPIRGSHHVLLTNPVSVS